MSNFKSNQGGNKPGNQRPNPYNPNQQQQPQQQQGNRPNQGNQQSQQQQSNRTNPTNPGQKPGDNRPHHSPQNPSRQFNQPKK